MTTTTLGFPSTLEPIAIATQLPTNFTSLTAIDSTLVVNPLAALALVGASSQPLTDIIPTLDEIEGTLTITNGFVTADLTTPFGPLSNSYDLVTLATDLNTTFQAASGTLNLLDGVATGNLAIADETYAGSFEFAQLVGRFVTNFLNDIEGTVPFANGQFALDIPTPFGAIEGTLDFGSGQFITDLETPFGPVNFAIEFPDDAQYEFTANGIPLTLDLAAGVITGDLVQAIPGPEVSLPLASLVGDILFADGDATINLNTIFGNFNIPFELADETGETLTEFLTNVTGTLTVEAGNLGADLVTDLGSFEGVFAASQFVTDLIATLPDYNGTLTFSQGTIAAALTTPYGPVNDTYNYGQYLDSIASLLDDLNLAIAV